MKKKISAGTRVTLKTSATLAEPEYEAEVQLPDGRRKWVPLKLGEVWTVPVACVLVSMPRLRKRKGK